MNYIPGYIRLHKEGKLKEIGMCLWEKMEACCLCPRACQINRLSGKRGYCGANAELEIAGYMRHLGEEPPISGKYGSGTIFFSNCPLRCVYCQNYSFSQEGEGVVYSIEKLADVMLTLQKIGVHNINLVSPEHYLAHIVLALDEAAGKGLNLPVVYNSSGYVREEILQLLDGVVDVYLCDAKYADASSAKLFSNAPDYPQVNQIAIKEMYRQVKDYVFDKEGIIKRGLIIRHLVLPNNLSGSFALMNWIRENIGKDVFISLMSQYYPFYRAKDYPQINRRISLEEYRQVQQWMTTLGLTKGWWQEDHGLDSLSGEVIRKQFEK